MACQHVLRLCGKSGYAQCEFCGSYRSLEAIAPEALYTPDYWTHERGHSTLTEQVYNVSEHKEGGKSKYEYVLERVETDDRSAALEIGCAPGRLLMLLQGIGRFERVVGIEACHQYEAAIREIGCFGGELRFGLFPDSADGLADETFSLILALDLLEHIEEPEPFLRECWRLLKPGGQLFLMMPLAEDAPDRFFAPIEHVWIHSKQSAAAMVRDAGFTVSAFDAWCPGHSSISARRDN